MILAVCANPAVDTLAWIQGLEAGQSHRIEKEKRFPGGKGVHVAMAAAELGEKVSLLCFWGGATGLWIRERCRSLGIDCYGPEIEDWSRVCYTFKSSGPYDDTELLGVGPSVSAEDVVAFKKIFLGLLEKASVVVLSGSLPTHAPVTLYADLIQWAHAKQVPSILDCTGVALEHALQAKPYGVHLNASETLALTGQKDSAAAAKKALPEIECLALTAGADGLYLRMREALVHANVTVDKVLSSVGSGDCLVAGLAVAKKLNLCAEESARLGAACGAANCVREDLGMLFRRDVDRLKLQAKTKGLP